MNKRIWLIILIMTLSFLQIFSAPKAVLWEKWIKHNRNSDKTINHSGWNKFLDKTNIFS